MLSSARNKIIWALLSAAGFYFLFVSLFSTNLADYDLWGYLSFGRLFWEGRIFPYQDVFSYTPTKTIWVYHEWLTGVLFYSIYHYTGAAGLQLFRYIIILVTIYLVYLTAQKRGGTIVWRIIALIPAALLISFGYVPVRAQIFSFLFFACSLFILEDARKKQTWSVLWWLLPIQVLWCNFHGGYPAGLGLIFLYGLGERLGGRISRPFWKMGIGAALVSLINPYGIHYWTYILQAVTMPRPDIDEWVSVFGALQKEIYGVPVYIFMLMALFGGGIYLLQPKKNYTDLLILSFLIFLGATHVRHTVFFGLVFGAFLPLWLYECWVSFKEKKYFLTRWPIFPQVILAIFFFSVYGFANPSGVIRFTPDFSLITPSPYFPTGAYYWIIQHRFRGNILPQFEWGEFLIWRLYPECRVALDGRYETVYTEDVLKQYFEFIKGLERGRDFLRKFPHDLVLLRSGSKAEVLMEREPRWKAVYRDSASILYLHQKDPSNAQGGEKGPSPAVP